MKVFALAPFAGLASFAVVSAADVSFTPAAGAAYTTKATFVESDGSIKFCPTGDCAKVFTTLLISRVEEKTTASPPVSKVLIGDITTKDPVPWTALAVNKDGTTEVSSSTTFVAPLFKDSDAATTTSGKLTLKATVYYVEKEVTYGTGKLTVPAGGILLESKLESWDLDPAEDTLDIEYTLTSSVKDATTSAAVNPTIAAKATGSNLQVVTIGDGMYLNAPVVSLIDTTDGVATPTIAASSSKLVVNLAGFDTKTLTYDVVLGYKAPATTPDTTPATTPATTTPATTTPAPSSATRYLGAISTFVAGGAALAYAFF